MAEDDTGRRVAGARRQRGLTQRELAELSRVSVSAIRKIEQGAAEWDIRVEMLRRLAVALEVPTASLLEDPPRVPAAETDRMWDGVREAILHPAARGGEPAAEAGLLSALDAAVGLYHDNRYRELSRVLPAVIRDAEDAPPLLRSRVHQLAGSVMVQTRNRNAARVALDRSVADAEAAGGPLDAASATITKCWLLLTERRFREVMDLSAQWADRVEPRMSTAGVRDLSVWGWLLLRGSAAAIRNNDAAEAADRMRLAQAAAAACGREQGGYKMYWTTFGPATTQMKRVENAVVDGRPDIALRLAREVPPSRPTSDNRNRHLLDVASAHLELGRWDESLSVLSRLHAEAGAWLAEQGMARGILQGILSRRRVYTPEMRELARFLHLEPTGR